MGDEDDCDPIRVMRARFVSPCSEKVNDHVMGKTLSAAALFQFIADKIVEMDLLGTGDDDGGDDGFAVVEGMDDGAEEIDPYAIKEGIE